MLLQTVLAFGSLNRTEDHELSGQPLSAKRYEQFAQELDPEFRTHLLESHKKNRLRLSDAACLLHNQLTHALDSKDGELKQVALMTMVLASSLTPFCDYLEGIEPAPLDDQEQIAAIYRRILPVMDEMERQMVRTGGAIKGIQAYLKVMDDAQLSPVERSLALGRLLGIATTLPSIALLLGLYAGHFGNEGAEPAAGASETDSTKSPE